MPTPRKTALETRPPTDELMRPQSAATYTGYTRQTMSQWRYLGKGPKYLKPTPRTIIYRKSDLDEWLAASLVDPTND